MGNETGSLTVLIDDDAAVETSLPIEIRDGSNLLLRGRVRTGESIDLPPGRYLITATLPDGRLAGAEEMLTISSGDTRHVSLMTPTKAKRAISSADMRATLGAASDPSPGHTVRNFVSDIEDAYSGTPPGMQRHLIGSWLRRQLDPSGASEPAELEVEGPYPTDASIAVSDRRRSVNAVLVDGGQKVLAAIPIDHEKTTKVRFSPSSSSERLRIEFDFGNAALNAFYQYVERGIADEARFLSRDVIAQAERLIVDKRYSPVSGIVSGYVLLRANEIDDMGMWGGTMLSQFNHIPDVFAIRMELLCRKGDHAQAIDLLLESALRDTPWFRSGVAYIAERALLYAGASKSKRARSTLPQVLVDRADEMEMIARVYSRLTASLDIESLSCVYRNLDLDRLGQMVAP